jgi:hypothetical protein
VTNFNKGNFHTILKCNFSTKSLFGVSDFTDVLGWIFFNTLMLVKKKKKIDFLKVLA